VGVVRASGETCGRGQGLRRDGQVGVVRASGETDRWAWSGPQERRTGGFVSATYLEVPLAVTVQGQEVGRRSRDEGSPPPPVCVCVDWKHVFIGWGTRHVLFCKLSGDVLVYWSAAEQQQEEWRRHTEGEEPLQARGPQVGGVVCTQENNVEEKRTTFSLKMSFHRLYSQQVASQWRSSSSRGDAPFTAGSVTQWTSGDQSLHWPGPRPGLDRTLAAYLASGANCSSSTE